MLDTISNMPSGYLMLIWFVGSACVTWAHAISHTAGELVWQRHPETVMYAGARSINDERRIDAASPIRTNIFLGFLALSITSYLLSWILTPSWHWYSELDGSLVTSNYLIMLAGSLFVSYLVRQSCDFWCMKHVGRAYNAKEPDNIPSDSLVFIWMWILFGAAIITRLIMLAFGLSFLT